MEAHSTVIAFQALGQENVQPIPLVGSNGNIIKITIKSMPMVFLEWSTRRPPDIMTSGLVVISIGDIWVGLDVLHSNGF
jgi:hypothetical protein